MWAEYRTKATEPLLATSRNRASHSTRSSDDRNHFHGHGGGEFLGDAVVAATSVDHLLSLAAPVRAHGKRAVYNGGPTASGGSGPTKRSQEMSDEQRRRYKDRQSRRLARRGPHAPEVDHPGGRSLDRRGGEVAQSLRIRWVCPLGRAAVLSARARLTRTRSS